MLHWLVHIVDRFSNLLSHISPQPRTTVRLLLITTHKHHPTPRGSVANVMHESRAVSRSPIQRGHASRSRSAHRSRSRRRGGSRSSRAKGRVHSGRRRTVLAAQPAAGLSERALASQLSHDPAPLGIREIPILASRVHALRTSSRRSSSSKCPDEAFSALPGPPRKAREIIANIADDAACTIRSRMLLLGKILSKSARQIGRHPL